MFPNLGKELFPSGFSRKVPWFLGDDFTTPRKNMSQLSNLPPK